MADRELGRTGEAVAARYYQKQGFCLLEHGFRTRMGELDLVVFKDDLLVIAEVKTRSSEAFLAPCEAVDLRKQQKILLATQQYLAQHPILAECTIRFDVVEVVPQPGGWRVHCIPNAFDAAL
ncbi:MAG: YraN family protein [Oscillospiraceae bacterium]|nr:YraN family protein [Oscillospiraceae bacterium]